MQIIKICTLAGRSDVLHHEPFAFKSSQAQKLIWTIEFSYYVKDTSKHTNQIRVISFKNLISFENSVTNFHARLFALCVCLIPIVGNADRRNATCMNSLTNGKSFR